MSRDDRCAFQGGACTLRRSEGGVFYRNPESFSWKRIVGVNPLPRGASVGELGKNLSPSKLRICQDIGEFTDTYRKESSDDLAFMIFMEFANLLIMGETIAE